MFRDLGLKTALYLVFVVATFLMIEGCSSTPKLESSLIRAWGPELEKEYPNKTAAIANYKKGSNELFYLAARHSTAIGSDTLNLVEELFDHHNFNVLVIEPIAYSFGESPVWLLEDAKKGLRPGFVAGQESAWAILRAEKKKIPFFGGEPDHIDIYQGLKKKGFNDQDVIGFYFVRQVPQWIRQRENTQGLLERKFPDFSKHYCKTFRITACPGFSETMKWYREQNGEELTADISNEVVAPYANGKFGTQRISFVVDQIRNEFTLKVIESLLAKYKKVAVVYGASHYVDLRNAFDASLGLPEFIEDSHIVNASIFEMHSSLWVNLHHWLYNEACFPEKKIQPIADLNESEVAKVQNAMKFYQKHFCKMDLLFDEPMQNLNTQLSRAENDVALDDSAIRDDVRQELISVDPIYRKHLWKKQNDENVKWMTHAKDLLLKYGPNVQKRLEIVLQRKFLEAPYKVDVVHESNWAGGYTYSPPHTVISSGKAEYSDYASLEMLFHECVHAGPFEKVQIELDSQIKSHGGKGPPQLWHAIHFYTVGWAVQSEFAKNGIEYSPYAFKNGLFGEKRSWAPFLPALNKFWMPYLEGTASLSKTLDNLVSATKVDK